jgi:hypothetical protein
MSNDKRRLTAIVLSALACTVLLVFSGVKLANYLDGDESKKTAFANKVQAYLTQKENVPESGILSVKGNYSFKTKEYGATVVFSDEPNVQYSYEEVEHTLKQTGTTNLKGKHYKGE